MIPAFMNKSQAAAYLGIDRGLFAHYIELKLIQEFYLPGLKSARISKKDLDSLINRLENYSSNDKQLFNAFVFAKEIQENKFKGVA